MSVLGLVPFVFVTGSNVLFVRSKKWKMGEILCHVQSDFYSDS